MTLIKFCSIDDLPEEQEEWLVDGLICPSLTLISGQPKHGKSLLAGHCIIGLINQTEVLNRRVKQGHHVVGWMGYDLGWREELRLRWQSVADNRIKMFDPLRNATAKDWRDLAEELHRQSITVFVIDHLYGVSGPADLNDASEVNKIFSLIKPIYEEFGIALVVLTQAAKHQFSNGRAANSVGIEAEARALIRIYDKKSKGARKLSIGSNTGDEEILDVTLTDTEFILRAKAIKVSNAPSDRESPDLVRSFLQSANPQELNRGWSGTGRELHRLGRSENARAGRQMAKRWEKQNLLQKNGTLVTAGSSLIPYNDINVS
jgi:hypothetical protein